MPIEKESIDLDRQLFKFLPLTIGIETLGGIFTPLILRGTPLPTTRYQTFSTASDNQEGVYIKIFIGERPIAQKNMKLADLELKGIPAAPKGIPQITLKIIVNNNLSIMAEVVESKSEGKASIDTRDAKIHLTHEEIDRILREGEENKFNDQSELRIKESENKIQKLISQAEDILSDKDKSKIYDSKKIEHCLAELGLAIQNHKSEEIEKKANELENLLNSNIPFADFSDIFKGFNGLFGPDTRKPTQSARPRSTVFNTPPKETLKQSYKDDRPTLGPTKYDIGKIFGGHNFTPDPNLCFVLMPFVKDMEPVYMDHIKPIIVSESISCQRADEIEGTNLITYDIWEKINRCRFIIADLTGKNPNVFYEIGLAHALGKEVILITQSMDDVPFDLKALRCIVYAFTPRGMKELEAKLIKTIRKIMISS